MSVEFSNQPQITKRQKPLKSGFSMSQTLIDWGVAKDDRQANNYLTIIAMVFFILSLLIWFI